MISIWYIKYPISRYIDKLYDGTYTYKIKLKNSTLTAGRAQQQQQTAQIFQITNKPTTPTHDNFFFKNSDRMWSFPFSLLLHRSTSTKKCCYHKSFTGAYFTLLLASRSRTSFHFSSCKISMNRDQTTTSVPWSSRSKTT